MQDNYSKYDGDFDEPFENHAWSEMSKLLDKDMPLVLPVARPTNNRKYLLLLLLFLLVGTGTGWFMGRQHYVATHAEETVQDISTTNENVNFQHEVEQSIDNKAVFKEKKNKVNLSTTKAIDKSNKAEKVLITSVENVSILNAKTINNQEFRSGLPMYVPSFVQPETVITEQEKNTISIEKKEVLFPTLDQEQDIKKSIKKSEPNQQIKEETLPRVLTRPIAMLDALDLKEIADQSNSKEVKVHQIVPTKQPFWKSNTIGIELGVYSKNLGSIDGFSIGGIVKYKSKSSPRLSYQTGLIYENIKTQGRSIADAFDTSSSIPVNVEFDNNGGIYDPETIVDILYSDSLEEIIDPTNGPVTGEVNQTIEQILVYNSFIRLHYLGLPFQVNYKALATLEFNAGLKLSYLLGSTLQNQNLVAVTADNLSISNNSGGFRNTNAVENDKLAKFDLRTYVGATWYPNPSLGLSLKYNLGLSKTFPNLTSTNWSDYKNNAFQASIMYLF